MIVSDNAGCAGGIEAEINGIIVPFKDVEKLAGALERFFSDPRLRKASCDASRKRALEKFDSVPTGEHVVNFYKKLRTATESSQ